MKYHYPRVIMPSSSFLVIIIIMAIQLAFSSGLLLLLSGGITSKSMTNPNHPVATTSVMDRILNNSNNNNDDDSAPNNNNMSRRSLFPFIALILSSAPSIGQALESEASSPRELSSSVSTLNSNSHNTILGPLSVLVGTWTGDQGLNIVAVPSRNSKPTQTGRFELIVRPYREVLTFTELPGDAVRNRGGDIDQYVGGLEYKQEVYATDSDADGDDDELIHIENGMMFYLENIQNYKQDADHSLPPKPTFSIARSATIPHGNSAMLLGNYQEIDGGPTIPDISSLPRNFGPKAPPEYTNPYKKPVDIVNPNALLLQNNSLHSAIKTQQQHKHKKKKKKNSIQKTIHFSFDSNNIGSTVTSIPFLVDRADTTRFSSDFWVETMKDGSSQQLQYSQSIDIAFHKPIGGGDGGDEGQDELIQWPHITVNTLTKSK